MDANRTRQFAFAEKFRSRSAQYPQPPLSADDPTEVEVRQFFFDIHAINYGQYAQSRKNAVENASFEQLVDILKCFDRRDKAISDRIKAALTEPPKGVKMLGLGPASMAEIPGWLLITNRSDYPVVNGKFVETLNHLGLYDSSGTWFPGS
jgi:hypothetical protein